MRRILSGTTFQTLACQPEGSEVRLLFGEAHNCDFEILYGILVNDAVPFISKNAPSWPKTGFSQAWRHDPPAYSDWLDNGSFHGNLSVSQSVVHVWLTVCRGRHLALTPHGASQPASDTSTSGVQQSLQSWPVHVRAGEAAVIIKFG